MKEKKQNPAEQTNEQAVDIENDSVNMGINADENMAGTTHLNDAIATEDEMEKLQSQLTEQKDKYIRLLAEFDNFKRRTAKERIELINTAGKDVIVSMLDVMDDCDRAEKVLQTSDDVAVIKEGIQLVFNKLRSNLQSKGLKAMESMDADFDVEKHEAITQIAAPTEEQKGKVLDEIVKGYYLNDKLIRFAKVVVGN